MIDWGVGGGLVYTNRIAWSKDQEEADARPQKRENQFSIQKCWEKVHIL